MDLWSEPPVIPSLPIPEAPNLPPPILDIPRAEVPNYKPIVVPPNTLRAPPGVKGIKTEDEPPKEDRKTKQPLPPEAQIIEVPFTDIEVPMPTTTIMTTAATTAFISVAATLTATSTFKWLVTIIKPIIKQTWSKLTKKKEQKVS